MLGTRDYIRKCGFRRVLIGLSGGIDSSLTAVIAVDAVGRENVIGVAMPGPYSSEGSVTDARALADNLGIRFEVVPITRDLRELPRARSTRCSPARRATSPRRTSRRACAASTLMALSNKWGALVLTTGNKSELAVGYCTLYGDMCGGLAVISDVPKTLVYELSRVANRRHPGAIPESVFNKPPSAELRPNQKDSDSLPPYDVLDHILSAYVEEYQTPRQIAEALGPAVDLVARHHQQGGPQRVQAPAGRAGPEGDHQGFRHRPPLPHRPEVLRMKLRPFVALLLARGRSALIAARAARAGRPAARRRLPAEHRLAAPARRHAGPARTRFPMSTALSPGRQVPAGPERRLPAAVDQRARHGHGARTRAAPRCRTPGSA